MAILNQTLTPLIPSVDPNQRIAALEARVAALEAVVQVQSSGDVTLKVVSALTLDAKSVTIDADTVINCKAGSGLTLEGGLSATIKAGGPLTASAGSTMTLKGATVNIN